MSHMHCMRVFHVCVAVASMAVRMRHSNHMLWTQGVVSTVVLPMLGDSWTQRCVQFNVYLSYTLHDI